MWTALADSVDADTVATLARLAAALLLVLCGALRGDELFGALTEAANPALAQAQAEGGEGQAPEVTGQA